MVKRSVPENMVDCTVGAPVEDVLLIERHHRRGVASAQGRPSTVVPLVMVKRSVPENMVDGTVSVPVKDVLLIRKPAFVEFIQRSVQVEPAGPQPVFVVF